MNFKLDKNHPAFPCDGLRGLTKREYFAALALQGLCAGEAPFNTQIAKQVEGRGSTVSTALAVYAVDLADELIKALND